MIWKYGITTTELRRNTLLPVTIDSLAKAGFDNPRLFVDGSKDIEGYEKQFDLSATVRYPLVRNYANWMLSAWTLWMDDPFADRYAIFEDDILTYRNLRDYLDATPLPENGYCNLFTNPVNHRLIKSRAREQFGWYRSNGLGKGALGLVFDNRTIEILLSSAGIAGHCKEWHSDYENYVTRTGTKKIDGLIVTVLKSKGIHEYVHYPSLVQHTGEETTNGSPKLSASDCFKGKDFDALTMVKK